MSDLRKAAEQALEALEGLSQDADEDCGEPRCGDCKPLRPARAAITALRAALDAQEPTRKAVPDRDLHQMNPHDGDHADTWSQRFWSWNEGFRAAEKFHGIGEGEA